MHRAVAHSVAALAALCLLGSLSPVRADIDMALNTSSFVAGQASVLSIDGTVTQQGDSTSILAATITLRFDPLKVAISNFAAPTGSGWSVLAYNLDHASQGWAKAVVLNLNEQTSTGSMILFTVTPADSSVVVDDCETLYLEAAASDMADGQSNSVYPSDPCAPEARSGVGDNPGTGSVTDSSLPSPFTGCDINTAEAARALRIWSGMAIASDEDMDALDFNVDEAVDWADIVTLMREPCRPNPRGWYVFQGSRRHTGRSPFALRQTVHASWAQPFSVGTAPSDMPPGLLAVLEGSHNVVYACTINPDGPGAAVYRVQDNGDGNTPALAPTPSQSLPNPRILPTNPGTGGEPGRFFPTGTPLLYNGKLFVPGEHTEIEPSPAQEGILYVLNAGDLSIEHIVNFGSGTYLRCAPVPNPLSVGVIVRVHTTAGNRLYCLSAVDATSQWSSPSAMEDLPTYDSMFTTSTPTSPCVYAGRVYTGSGNGDIHSRSLETGEGDSTDLTYYDSDASVLGSLVAFNGAIFADAIDDSGSETKGMLTNLPWDFTGTPQDGYRWLTLLLDGQVRSTPAVNQDYRDPNNPTATVGNILVATDGGNVYSYWTEKVPTSTEPHPVSEDPISLGFGPLKCSPVVFGLPGTTPTALIGTAEGFVYSFDAGTLSSAAPLKDSLGQDVQLSSAINAPLAVCQGPDGNARVYALSTAGELVAFH